MGEWGEGVPSRLGGRLRGVEGARLRALSLQLLGGGAGGTGGGVLEGVGETAVGLVLLVLGGVLRELIEHLHVVGGVWGPRLVGQVGGVVRGLVAHRLLLTVGIAVTGKLWRHSNAPFLPVATYAHACIGWILRLLELVPWGQGICVSWRDWTPGGWVLGGVVGGGDVMFVL